MSTSRLSKKRTNDLKNLAKQSDNNIDYSDIPELTDSFWKNAKIELPKAKKPITIRLDQDVILWYKNHFKEYQTAINAVLKSYIKAQK